MRDKSENVVVRVFGASWVIGWLFTAGFVHLGAWKGLLCFVLWPWVLGDALGPS